MILSLLLASAALVQSADPADELKQEVDAYKEILADRDREDEAIPHIDKFVQRSKANATELREIEDMLELKEGSAEELKKKKKELEKEQKLLADTVWVAFTARKQVTEPHLRLWKAAAIALGQMGSHGAGYLVNAYKQDRFDKYPDDRAFMVEQIGYTKDYSKDKELVDLLDFHQDVVIAAAAKAMAQFSGAPGKSRQYMVENLVKILESYSNAASNIEDTTSVQKYTTVRGPLVDALKALTPMSFDQPLDWTKWWNNNKNKPEFWKDPQ
ncbi:MAG: hypothetical protein EYC70_10965 [Planctomycetota bacterium]|nr:MAG: hypothetical protein EYC70_10965 [Planctomycetota bacterium]